MAGRLGNVFWELTYRCRLACPTCRNPREPRRRDELPPDVAARVADRLIAVGARRVVLTGGEPTLYPGWEKLATRLAAGGVRVRLFTSGYGFDRATLDAALDHGVTEFAVSLDGPRVIHDRLRPPPRAGAASPHDAAWFAIERLLDRGTNVRVATQVTKVNLPHLDLLYDALVEKGVPVWQVHLWQPVGAARDECDRLLCEPGDLETIVAVLLRAARDKRLAAPMHCTIGYMTEEEPVLRYIRTPGKIVWTGCQAGLTTLTIAPDGGVKGCPTMPDSFTTASLRDRDLAEIWMDDAAFPYARGWTPDRLRDSCAACAFGRTCRAGCLSLAYALTGTLGANPFCLRLVRN